MSDAGYFVPNIYCYISVIVSVQLTLLQPRGQIMPYTLLLVHPDLKTQRQLCHVSVTQFFIGKIIKTLGLHQTLVRLN